MAALDDSWHTQSFRQTVALNIEEAIQRSGLPSPKNSSELEYNVYQKARSKGEYLGHVAELILHIRDTTERQRMSNPIAALETPGNNRMMEMAGPVPGLQLGLVQQPPSNTATNRTGVMTLEEGSWRTSAFRQSVIAKIEEAVRVSRMPFQQNSIEMENHVFQQSRSRSEYLSLVARVILNFIEMRTGRGTAFGNGNTGQGIPPQARDSLGGGFNQIIGSVGVQPWTHEMVQSPLPNSSTNHNHGAPPLPSHIQMPNLPEDDLRRDTQCSVCRVAQSCYLCIPCYHMVLCGQCANKIICTARDYADGNNPMFGPIRCLLCNQNATEFKRVYMPIA